MEELVKIHTSKGGKAVVMARDLHEALEVRKKFTEWIKDQLDWFVQGVDYQASPLEVKAGPGSTIRMDYIITVDCAKEMAMMSKVPMGRTIRQYFIACEKKLREMAQPKFQIPQTMSEALQLAADLAKKVEDQAKQIEQAAPKVAFADAVSTSQTDILIRDLAKLIAQNGVDIGEQRLYEWMVQGGYLERRRRWSNRLGRYENQYWPTQKSAELKIFRVNETVIQQGNANGILKPTVKVNPKGQQYFINKIVSSKP